MAKVKPLLSNARMLLALVAASLGGTAAVAVPVDIATHSGLEIYEMLASRGELDCYHITIGVSVRQMIGLPPQRAAVPASDCNRDGFESGDYEINSLGDATSSSTATTTCLAGGTSEAGCGDSGTHGVCGHTMSAAKERAAEVLLFEDSDIINATITFSELSACYYEFKVVLPSEASPPPTAPSRSLALSPPTPPPDSPSPPPPSPPPVGTDGSNLDGGSASNGRRACDLHIILAAHILILRAAPHILASCVCFLHLVMTWHSLLSSRGSNFGVFVGVMIIVGALIAGFFL